MVFPSREGCLRVSPGLNLGPDCIVRVGRDGDPVAAEVHVVDLTIRVVAPECRGIELALVVACRLAAVGSSYAGVCEDRSDAGVEPGEGVVPVGQGPDDFCAAGILVHDLCRVRLLGLLDWLVCYTCGYVSCTSEGIRYDDRLNDRIEHGCICNRVRKSADCGLDIGVWNEICHVFYL